MTDSSLQLFPLVDSSLVTGSTILRMVQPAGRFTSDQFYVSLSQIATYIGGSVGAISSIVAGTGLTGGGSSGAVTLSVDSTIATKTYVTSQGYILANQTITLSGDITGSGTTAITATLATVNSNVGTFQGITVNAKGLVTAASAQGYAQLIGATFTGKLATAASTTTTAGLILPHGAAPTSPVNGDIWTTTAGMFTRINGATVGPFAASGTGISGMTAGQIPIAASATTITSSGNLSGDITTSGSLATTLATVNSNVGTFQGITVNAKGLVTAASNQGYAALAGATFTGEVVTPASTTTTAGLNLPHGAAPTSPVNGDLWTTTAGLLARINGATVGPFAASGTGLSGMSAGQIPIAASASTITSSANISGDATTNSSLALTLATVNSNVGTFQGITVNAKGLVTAAANQSYLTGNQTITLSGDTSGSGTTAITTTLATVNSNVGTFQGITVNGKGLVTAASAQGYATLASPTFTGTPALPTGTTGVTQSAGNNTTALATTAFVTAAAAAVLPAGTTRDQLIYSGGAWTAQRPKWTIGSYAPGIPTATQTLLMHRVDTAVTIPINFGTYLGKASQAGGSANATASTVITVAKAANATPNTFSTVGTITFATGTVTPTFATSGGTTITLAQGDVLRLQAPGSPDATFSDFYCSIVGYET